MGDTGNPRLEELRFSKTMHVLGSSQTSNAPGLITATPHWVHFFFSKLVLC